MLDGLRRSDKSGIENRLVLGLAHDVIGFLDDPVNSRTVDALGFLAVQPEHLLQSGHVIFGFALMRLKPLLELLIVGFLDHVGEGVKDLFFGIVHVAQRVHEQVIHCLDVF